MSPPFSPAAHVLHPHLHEVDVVRVDVQVVVIVVVVVVVIIVVVVIVVDLYARHDSDHHLSEKKGLIFWNISFQNYNYFFAN